MSMNTMKQFAISVICIILFSMISCQNHQEAAEKRTVVINDTTFIKYAVDVSIPTPEDLSYDTLFVGRHSVITYRTMGTYFIDTIEYASTRFIIKAIGGDHMLIFPDNDIFARNYKPRQKDFRLPSAAYEEFYYDSIYSGYPEVNSLFFSYIPKDAIFKLTAIYPAHLSPKEFMSRFRIWPANPALLDLYVYKQYAYKNGEIAMMFPGGD